MTVHYDRSMLFVHMKVHYDRFVLFVHMTVYYDRSVLFVHMKAAGSFWQPDGSSVLYLIALLVQSQVPSFSAYHKPIDSN